MKLLLAFLCAACLWPAFAEDKPSSWQLDPQPALAPGLIGDWDDFAIGPASVVKLADGSRMFYEGIAFDEHGLRTALGVAESQNDGATWTKHSQNPSSWPSSDTRETCSGFTVTRWRESFWCAYVAYADPFRIDPSSGNSGDGSASVHVMRSKDGLIWSRPSIVGAPIVSESFPSLKRCLVGDETALHLWWLEKDKNGQLALAHTLSRDGTAWSKPNLLPTSQFDERPICCVRVYHSGDFYIITYVARDANKPGNSHVMVTKTSNNARTWVANGPPEFPLAWHDGHAEPMAVFSSAGARIYYHEQRADGTVVLRSAFCRKEHYANR